jgi:NADPH:quinone reductase
MKAWRVHELGEPIDVLRLEDVPEPQPSEGQLRVRVRAAATNFPDALMCRGQYQIRPETPFTPGIELCGEVTAIGDGATGFAIGDRVIGAPELPAGAFAEHRGDAGQHGLHVGPGRVDIVVRRRVHHRLVASE